MLILVKVCLCRKKFARGGVSLACGFQVLASGCRTWGVALLVILQSEDPWVTPGLYSALEIWMVGVSE